MQDRPREIVLTADESNKRVYGATNLQLALEGLHQDGLLLLKAVVEVDHIDHLRGVMSAQTHEILHSKERQGMYNQGVQSNILQCPPLDHAETLYDDVYFNPFVIQIANA